MGGGESPPPYYLANLSIMYFSKTQKNCSCRVNPLPHPWAEHTQFTHVLYILLSQEIHPPPPYYLKKSLLKLYDTNRIFYVFADAEVGG